MLVGCTDKTVRVMGPGGNYVRDSLGPRRLGLCGGAMPTVAAGFGSGDGTVRSGPRQSLFTLEEGTTLP